MTVSAHAAAAKLIRTELKNHGVKARVRATFDRIDVSLADPTPAIRASVESFCSQFVAGHFDGMTDCYEYSKTRKDIPQVRFIFVMADYSDELKQAAWDYCRGHWEGMSEAPESHKKAGSFYAKSHDRYGDQMIHRTLSEARAGFWAAIKPRVRVQAIAA